MPREVAGCRPARIHGGRKVVGALPEGSPNDRVAAEQSCDDIAERVEHAHGVHYAADRNIRPINELPRQHLRRSHKLAATVARIIAPTPFG